MKKIILTLIFCITLAGAVRAQVTCWGTPIQGKNGHTYCQSTQSMTWYAALGWCDAQGRHLASVSELCDYGGSVYGVNADSCVNNNGTARLWTSTPCIGEHGLSSYNAFSSVECPINARRRSLYHAMCY